MSSQDPAIKVEPVEEDDLEEKEEVEDFEEAPPLKKNKKNGKGAGSSSKKNTTSDLSAEEKKRRRLERVRERNRQKRESMTPEELAEMRRKNAAKERARLAAKSPEEVEAIFRKKAERARERKRREGKETTLTTPELLEEMRREHAAVERARLAAKTPEELEEWRRKRAAAQRARLAAKSEEELAERRRKLAAQARARMAAKNPEQMEEIRRRHTEQHRKRYRERPDREEMLKKRSFQNFVRRVNMTEEEREAQRQKKYLYQQAWKATKGMWRDPAEVEAEKERRKLWFREWSKNLSGEKRQRHKENVQKAVRKYHEKLKAGGSNLEEPDKWRERREKNREYQRSLYANETPEERERRRYKEKVNGARRKLRRQLEGMGVDKEEIERRDEELKVRMWKEFDPEGEVPPNRRRRREPVQESPAVVKVDTSFQEPEPVGEIREDVLSNPPSPPRPPASPDYCMAPMDDDSNDFCPPLSPPSPPVGGFGESPVIIEEDPNGVASIQCPHCVLVFSFDTDLRDHVRSSHPEKCWKCPKCGEVMLSPQELSQHYQTSHKKTETQVAVVPSPLNVNVEVTSPSKFLCMKCPQDNQQAHPIGFEKRHELLSHVKVSHPGNYWPCDHCNLLKYSSSSLQVHLSLCRKNLSKLTHPLVN